MSYKVYGRYPDARAGEYFAHRANWPSIVGCLRDLAPTEIDDYDSLVCGGLDAKESIVLADILERCLAEGLVDKYVAERNGDFIVMNRHLRVSDLYVSDMREFSEFLRHSGGFTSHEWDD